MTLCRPRKNRRKSELKRGKNERDKEVVECFETKFMKLCLKNILRITVYGLFGDII